MIPNPLLSITIPTYNRADFLNYSLELHIPLAKEYNIQISIFDNASTDHTEQIVSKWMKEYPYLSYHKNETNIGPDANFERALKYPSTEYVWLLGDTYQIPDKGINYLLTLIENKRYDAIVFNLAIKINIPTKDYNNSNLLLNNLGALMTCLSCLVYNKELIDRANFSRYYNSHFIQVGVIFEDISNKKFLIHWAQPKSIKLLEHQTLKKTNWSHTSKAFEIGCEDWTNFVMSLPPSYKIHNKMKCIMDFGEISGLFTLKNLILLRIANLLNFKIFNKYKELFRFVIDFPLSLIIILSTTPKFILKSLSNITKLVLKKR